MRKKPKEEVRRNMQAIKSSNTGIERKLSKMLWADGLRYRKNDKTVYGRPDITFKRYRIAIFCDSDFWHGKDWPKLKERLVTNSEYWIPKIERNIARDIQVTTKLEESGWIVLRFWENDINKNVEDCVSRVKDVYAKQAKRFEEKIL